jgi:Two component regulator propeller.
MYIIIVLIELNNYICNNLIYKYAHLHKKIIILFSLFLQLFTINSVYSNNKKNGNYLYRHYNNIKENIDLVYSITQDSNGYIWIYSNSGLFRFDGNELDKAENMGIENINMLSNISFCTLDGDLNNRLWIRNTQNLYCLNVKDGKLTSHLKEKFNNGLHLYTSAIDNNKLWLGTSEGLILYNPESEMDTTKIYIKDIFALSGRYNNTIWGALQDNRIIKYNVKENNYEIIENTLIKGIPSLIKQINDTIVLIGCKDNGGLWLYNTEKNIFNNLISNTTINCIEPFFNNQFCMATKNGIYVLNPQNNEIELIRKGNIPYLSIPESFVSTIKQDKEGGIWIGTYYQGFSYIPNQPIDLNFYIPEKTDKNLKGNVVMSFCEDKYNNLWVATQDDGVNMFNLKTKEFINYSRNNNEKKILSSNFFNTIAIDDEVWLGSIDLGIEVIDILSGRSIRKYAKGDDANSLNSNIIITFHYSYNKVLYVGTAEGLMQYNKLNDNFTPILPGIIKSTSCIFKDDEFLWVGTWDGLYKIDKNNNFEIYKNIAEDSTSISSSTISSIFKGSDGALYFGTYNGFNVYNKKITTSHATILIRILLLPLMVWLKIKMV